MTLLLPKMPLEAVVFIVEELEKIIVIEVVVIKWNSRVKMKLEAYFRILEHYSRLIMIGLAMMATAAVAQIIYSCRSYFIN